MKRHVLITKNKTNVTTHHDVLILHLLITFFFVFSCNGLENLDTNLMLSPVMDNEPKHVTL
jgi:hypothetical protein